MADDDIAPEEHDKSDEDEGEDDTGAGVVLLASKVTPQSDIPQSPYGAIAPPSPIGDMPSDDQDGPVLPGEGPSQPDNDSDQDDGGGLFTIPLPLPIPVPQPTTIPLPIPLPSPSARPAPQPESDAVSPPPLVAAPIPAYVPKPTPRGSHYVQVHATPHEYSICEIWFSLKEAYPDLFAYAEQSVSRLDREDGSVWFRLRVGAFETSEAAATFCARLKDEGHECFVVPTASP
ncbi:MAG: SPOR domain-containing protein [Hyphomonadaceae bacterium]